MDHAAPPRCRFGPFELDTRSGALLRDGATTHLQEQPLQVLLVLIEHAGAVVTRDELRRRVWRDETFVGFDHGLNSIIRRLRDALGDDAERHSFIETLPRRDTGSWRGSSPSRPSRQQIEFPKSPGSRAGRALAFGPLLSA